MGINFRHQLNEVPSIPGYAPTVPAILSQSNEYTYTGDAETIDINGSTINVPKGFFGPGATFKFTMAGYRTGTADAATITILIGATTVLTLALPSNTAVDFLGEFYVAAHTDFAHQNCWGYILSQTVLSVMDQAQTTASTVQDVVLKAQVTLASASDEIFIKYCKVEYWQIEEDNT